MKQAFIVEPICAHASPLRDGVHHRLIFLLRRCVISISNFLNEITVNSHALRDQFVHGAAVPSVSSDSHEERDNRETDQRDRVGSKISSSSSNEEKIPTTPYAYEGSYLVIQRCLFGSTYVGAYLDAKKTFIMKASFTSKYDQQGGPKKMENLKIELVRDADLSIPQN